MTWKKNLQETQPSHPQVLLRWSLFCLSGPFVLPVSAGMLTLHLYSAVLLPANVPQFNAQNIDVTATLFYACGKLIVLALDSMHHFQTKSSGEWISSSAILTACVAEAVYHQQHAACALRLGRLPALPDQDELPCFWLKRLLSCSSKLTGWAA